MISFLVPVFFTLIFGGALAAAAAPVLFLPTKVLQMAALAFAPFIFTVAYVVIAGALSLTGRAAIVQGTFPRDLKHKVYGRRRLYAACWTAIYYFTPLYFLCLQIAPLKKLLFRLFGYKGSMDFTIYPDTWVRDLPCLLFEDKVYIANKATLGTNMCLTNGNILVDRIKIAKGGMIGHAALVAPGAKIYENAEIGVDTRLGIRSTYKKNCKISPSSFINHGCVIGENASVGSRSYLGLKVVVGDNIDVPAGANIPAGASLLTQADVDQFFSSETAKLQEQKEETLQLLEALEEKAA